MGMELPEMIVLGQQMDKELKGKRISDIEVVNPKCLNMPLGKVRRLIKGKKISSVTARGKWLFISTDTHFLLFNPGMGADVLYFTSSNLPDKYQIRIEFENRTGITISVSWFCYLHVVENLRDHRLTANLGMSPLDESFSLEHFVKLLNRKRGFIKSFLLNQKNVAGIGNFYIHDILFNAKIHPLRKIPSLTSQEIEALYHSMREVLLESVKLGGARYEKDFYGNRGGFGAENFKVGYSSGLCPVCSTQVQKIRTGSTSSYVCLKCQPL